MEGGGSCHRQAPSGGWTLQEPGSVVTCWSYGRWLMEDCRKSGCTGAQEAPWRHQDHSSSMEPGGLVWEEGANG